MTAGPRLPRLSHLSHSSCAPPCAPHSSCAPPCAPPRAPVEWRQEVVVVVRIGVAAAASTAAVATPTHAALAALVASHTARRRFGLKMGGHCTAAVAGPRQQNSVDLESFARPRTEIAHT